MTTFSEAAGTAGTAGTSSHLQRGRNSSSFTHMEQGERISYQGTTGTGPRSPRSPRNSNHSAYAPPGTPAGHGEQPTLKAFFEQGQRTKEMADPLPWIEELLRSVGSTRIPDSPRGKWQCPAHATTGEHSTSLRLTHGRDGRLLMFCHAGCDFRDILRALKIPGSSLMYPPATKPEVHARFYLRRMKFPTPKSGGSLGERGLKFEAEHEYGSPVIAWKMRYRHPTSGEKDIRWESLNPNGERVPGLLGRRQVDLPLYHERDVLMAVAAEEPVILVESESSVDALVKAGHYATTWAGGAADPPVERLTTVLGGYAHLVLIPDNDDAGLKCLAKLKPLGGHVLMMGEPDEDARDLLDRVGATGFQKLINERETKQ